MPWVVSEPLERGDSGMSDSYSPALIRDETRKKIGRKKNLSNFLLSVGCHVEAMRAGTVGFVALNGLATTV